MGNARILFAALLLLASGLAFPGCSTTGTTGRQITDEEFAPVKLGVTTEAQIREWFGEPSSVEVAANGEKRLVYFYLQFSSSIGFFGGNSNSESQVVRFDITPEGIVENYWRPARGPTRP